MRTREVDPDAYLENADNERLMRIIIEMAKNGGGYQEANTSRFEKWILTVLASLVVGVAGAGVTIYGKQSVQDERSINIQAQLSYQQQQIALLQGKIDRLLEEHYRDPKS